MHWDPRAAVCSVVAARGGHGVVNHEQLLHGQLYREGMGGGANSGFLNGGYSNSYLTTSVAWHTGNAFGHLGGGHWFEPRRIGHGAVGVWAPLFHAQNVWVTGGGGRAEE